VWDELATLPESFVLYGGTAIALQLGHRISEDFDFFANRALDGDDLLRSMPFLSQAVVTQREPGTLGCRVDRGGPVRLSFYGVPALPRLRPPLVAADNAVRIASLLDLAGTKASVVQLRAEAKDYLDIDAILADGRVDLPTALAAGQALYGTGFNPLATLKALSYFGDGTLPRLPQAVRDRLLAAVSAVDTERLPVIAPAAVQDQGDGRG
jgi:hypothetical protein